MVAAEVGADDPTLGLARGDVVMADVAEPDVRMRYDGHSPRLERCEERVGEIRLDRPALLTAEHLGDLGRRFVARNPDTNLPESARFHHGSVPPDPLGGGFARGFSC